MPRAGVKALSLHGLHTFTLWLNSVFLSVPVDSKESQSLMVSTIACATTSFPDGHYHFMYVLTNAFGHFLMRHSNVVFTQCFVVLLSLQFLRVRGILKYMATDTLMCESAPDPHRRGRGEMAMAWSRFVCASLLLSSRRLPYTGSLVAQGFLRGSR